MREKRCKCPPEEYCSCPSPKPCKLPPLYCYDHPSNLHCCTIQKGCGLLISGMKPTPCAPEENLVNTAQNRGGKEEKDTLAHPSPPQNICDVESCYRECTPISYPFCLRHEVVKRLKTTRPPQNVEEILEKVDEQVGGALRALGGMKPTPRGEEKEDEALRKIAEERDLEMEFDEAFPAMEWFDCPNGLTPQEAAEKIKDWFNHRLKKESGYNLELGRQRGIQQVLRIYAEHGTIDDVGQLKLLNIVVPDTKE